MIDIGYGIRLAGLLWKYKGKKCLKNPFCETVINGRCWTNDLDTNFHMNNSRFLRECDFGRFALLMETGLWGNLIKQRQNGINDATILVNAIQVQYRQSIELGDQFHIHSRISGWDEKAFYIEQWIILNKNKQIAFSLLARVVPLPHSLTPQILIDQLQMGDIQSPTLSESIQIFKDNHRLNIQHISSKI